MQHNSDSCGVPSDTDAHSSSCRGHCGHRCPTASHNCDCCAASVSESIRGKKIINIQNMWTHTFNQGPPDHRTICLLFFSKLLQDLVAHNEMFVASGLCRCINTNRVAKTESADRTIWLLKVLALKPLNGIPMKPFLTKWIIFASIRQEIFMVCDLTCLPRHNEASLGNSDRHLWLKNTACVSGTLIKWLCFWCFLKVSIILNQKCVYGSQVVPMVSLNPMWVAQA